MESGGLRENSIPFSDLGSEVVEDGTNNSYKAQKRRTQ